MINKYPESFVKKLGPGDRIKVPPIKLKVEKRKAEQMHPTNHIKPYIVPYIYVNHSKEKFVIY